MNNEQSSDYHVYVLRYWSTKRYLSTKKSWCFTLENPESGQRMGFTAVVDLADYLEQQTIQDDAQNKQPHYLSTAIRKTEAEQSNPFHLEANIMSRYAHPETLVDTAWVAANLGRSNTCLVEVDVDTSAYSQGHIPGAIGWNWTTDTQDQVTRDIPGANDFKALLERSGISNDTTVIFYGDNNNWFAAYALWLMKYYGHNDVRLMDGGRKKWLAEGRETTTDTPQPDASTYQLGAVNTDLRALRPFVEESVGHAGRAMVDVRSPAEFSGELLAPATVPQEGSQRGGHIPGAKNIGWGTAVNEDGTFKSRDALDEIYGSKGVTSDKEVIAYCRIGERSSLSWYVLKYLMGYEGVRNYDGSWTEWGSSIGVPIEKTYQG